MKNRIMHKDFAKAFRLILVIFIVLAVFTAVAIPLSLSQQISDASNFRQQAQAADMTEHQAERALKSSITPLTQQTMPSSADSAFSGQCSFCSTGLMLWPGFIKRP